MSTLFIIGTAGLASCSVWIARQTGALPPKLRPLVDNTIGLIFDWRDKSASPTPAAPVYQAPSSPATQPVEQPTTPARPRRGLI